MPILFTDQSGLLQSATSITDLQAQPGGVLDANCDGYEYSVGIKADWYHSDYISVFGLRVFQYVTITWIWRCCDGDEHKETRRYLEANNENAGDGKGFRDSQYLHNLSQMSEARCGKNNTKSFIEIRALELGLGRLADTKAHAKLYAAGGFLQVDLEGELSGKQNPTDLDFGKIWSGAKNDPDKFMKKGSFNADYQGLSIFAARWNCKSKQCEGSSLFVQYQYMHHNPPRPTFSLGDSSP